MEISTLVSEAFGVAGVVSAVWFGMQAKSYRQSSDARRNAAQASMEELQIRVAELTEQLQKRSPKEPTSTGRDSAIKQQLKEKEAAAAALTRERDAALKRIQALQNEIDDVRMRSSREQQRLIEERRDLEFEYEASIADLKKIAAGIPLVTTPAESHPGKPASPPADEHNGLPVRQPRPKSGVPASTARMRSKDPVRLLFATVDGISVELAEPLAMSGYAVTVATTGAELIRLAREFQPALIALDAQLGKRGSDDNFSLLSTLKGDDALRDIPVVVICSVRDRERATEMGAVGCVGSPAAPNVLLGALNAALVARKKRAERSRLAQSAKGVPV